jgi:acyl carrier protein phosphodiesterase
VYILAMAEENPNIDKAVDYEEDNPIEQVTQEVNVDADGIEESDFVELADGSAETMDDEPRTEAPFNANLAEYVDDQDLQMVSSEIMDSYYNDKASREDWEQAYVKGLDLLGFKEEVKTEPFRGASGVVHPMLAESAVQFQAQAYKEMLPAGGPVKTQIVGAVTNESEDQAQRVQDFMNYQITYAMKDFDPELDQLLFYLPLAGSAFKKIYYDDMMERAVAKFVPAEDLVVPYGASSLETCERIVHIVKMSENQVKKSQVTGFYREVPIRASDADDNDDIQSKYDQLEGSEKVLSDQVTLLECHVELDLPGFEDVDVAGESTGLKLPYVVTIDEGTGNVLSIYRNYQELDPLRRRKDYFVHYKFLPGLGFYGFGMIHMIGGLSRAASVALRQLLDAGTLSNLPAGFKQRGLRIRDDKKALTPGEFRDVDAPGGDLRGALMPLPYKEPSATLYSLLGFIVEAGSRFAAVADQKIGEGSQANPVGTTVALLERGAKIMSAIHKRLHYAQKLEFNLLADVFKSYLPPEYPYNIVGGNRMIKQMDFDDRVDILPVSDPNIFSMAQRVTLAQTQLQLAQSNPQIHNQYEAYKRMYEALGVQNIEQILPPPMQPMPLDPAVENSMSIKGSPFQAYPQQDHEAHIDAHRAFMSTVLVKSLPQAMAALQGHISEHISLLAQQQVQMEYQQQIQQLQQQAAVVGPQQIQMAQQQLMMEIEKATAVRIAQITNDLLAEEQEAVASNEDPLVDLKSRELDIKEQQVMNKAKTDDERTELDKMKLASKIQTDKERIETQEDIAQLRANVQYEKMERNDKKR